jgi:enterochelin esterase-like enzyme
MNIKNFFILTLLVLTTNSVIGQQESAKLTFNISVKKELKASFKSNGRLLIYISGVDGVEPRNSSAFNGNGFVFGKNIKKWNKNETKSLNGNEDWTKTSNWNFNSIPHGNYNIQLVWSQNGNSESQINSPGNLYTESIKINTKIKQEITISLSKIIPERKLVQHDLVAFFSIKSNVLSNWWNRPMNVKVSVLLPSGYSKNPNKKYPIRYNVAGYGGRYTRVNRLVDNKEFISWWKSDEAPQVITVFLDGEGPFGDSYQLDSDNSGPYGEMLINELIPKIEKQYRAIGSPKTRFVDGCSTGGWVSLALQLFYPEKFNGCWSYSPDPVSFNKMQLVDIYKDENAFYNNRMYLRPSKRNINGDPQFSIKEEIYYENVNGASNTYTTSGGQWSAWNALYSPKGKDGLPKPVFDPVNGAIDKQVAEHWKKHDLLLYTKANWAELGPKVNGKINIWMGDMDNYYLNNAMRDFDEYLKSTTNPKSDALIEFSPMKQHCQNYSHKYVLEEIQKRVKEMKNK